VRLLLLLLLLLLPESPATLLVLADLGVPALLGLWTGLLVFLGLAAVVLLVRIGSRLLLTGRGLLLHAWSLVRSVVLPQGRELSLFRFRSLFLLLFVPVLFRNRFRRVIVGLLRGGGKKCFRLRLRDVVQDLVARLDGFGAGGGAEEGQEELEIAAEAERVRDESVHDARPVFDVLGLGRVAQLDNDLESEKMRVSKMGRQAGFLYALRTLMWDSFMGSTTFLSIMSLVYP
jgi:hypothetical protein